MTSMGGPDRGAGDGGVGDVEEGGQGAAVRMDEAGEEEPAGDGERVRRKGSMGHKYLQVAVPKQKRRRILKERQRRDRIR